MKRIDEILQQGIVSYEPACPMTGTYNGQEFLWSGLSVRAYMAIEFKKAMISKGELIYRTDVEDQAMNELAIKAADSLIKELNK